MDAWLNYNLVFIPKPQNLTGGNGRNVRNVRLRDWLLRIDFSTLPTSLKTLPFSFDFDMIFVNVRKM